MMGWDLREIVAKFHISYAVARLVKAINARWRIIAVWKIWVLWCELRFVLIAWWFCFMSLPVGDCKDLSIQLLTSLVVNHRGLKHSASRFQLHLIPMLWPTSVPPVSPLCCLNFGFLGHAECLAGTIFWQRHMPALSPCDPEGWETNSFLAARVGKMRAIQMIWSSKWYTRTYNRFTCMYIYMYTYIQYIYNMHIHGYMHVVCTTESTIPPVAMPRCSFGAVQ